MQPRDVLVYLYDIRVACETIARYTADKDLDVYLADEYLRDAVERRFITVGEAINQAFKVEPNLAERIGDCAEIIAFRNRIVHGYYAINHRTVWGVVETKLPALRREVDALLAERGGENES